MITDYLDASLEGGTLHNTSKGYEVSYLCPFCGDYKERLFVNMDKQVYCCHNCGQTGSMITFISNYAKIPWVEALNVYRGYEGYERTLPDSLETEIYEKLSTVTVEQKKYIYPLPEEFVPIEELTGESSQKVAKYLKNRGIPLSKAERYFLGYCEEGKYAGRIILPDFESGELVYWQARTIKSTPKSAIAKKLFRKVLNPSLTEEQIANGVVALQKSEVLGNIDFVLDEGMAVICESKFDAMSIGDIGANIYGKSLSDHQLMKLVTNKNKIDLVVVMLDGDAFDKTVSTADRLYRYFDDVYVARLPKDKDPNELGTKKVLDILNNDLVKYTPMFMAKCKLKGWI